MDSDSPAGSTARFDAKRYGIWIILLVALVFRLAAVAQHGVMYLGGFPDAMGYMESARILARTGELTFYGVHRSALVMPGFVGLLALYFIPPWSAETAFTLVKLTLIGMSVASTYVVYRLGIAISDFRVGLLAGGIFALSVPTVYTATLPLTENPFLLVVLCFIWGVVTCAQAPSWKRFALVLIVFVCGVFVRQTMLGLALPAVIYLLIRCYPAKLLVRQLVVAVLVLAVSLAPWVARNYRVFHAFVPFTTADSAPFYEGAFQRFDPGEATRAANARADVILSTVGPSGAERNRVLNAAGRERILERWRADKVDLVLSYAVLKPASAWLTSFYWDEVLGIPSRLVLWVHAALTAIGLAALVVLAILSARRAEFTYLLLNVLMITAGVSYYLGLSRYVFPFTPLPTLALAHLVIRGLSARGPDGRWKWSAIQF